MTMIVANQKSILSRLVAKPPSNTTVAQTEARRPKAVANRCRNVSPSKWRLSGSSSGTSLACSSCSQRVPGWLTMDSLTPMNSFLKRKLTTISAIAAGLKTSDPFATGTVSRGAGPCSVNHETTQSVVYAFQAVIYNKNIWRSVDQPLR